jgi:hypothetical protein
MGELLAKKPSILIMSICSLYHIFYVGISDIACNEFTKRSTRSDAPFLIWQGFAFMGAPYFDREPVTTRHRLPWPPHPLQGLYRRALGGWCDTNEMDYEVNIGAVIRSRTHLLKAVP